MYIRLCVSITIVIVIEFSAETGCVQPKRPEQKVKFLFLITFVNTVVYR